MFKRLKIPLAAMGFVLVTLILAVMGLTTYRDWLVRNGQWLDGSKTSAVATAYDQGHPARDNSISLWAAANYFLFNEGNTGLHIGNNDWLYASEELLQSANENEQVAAAQLLIKQINDRLKVNGVDLVVVIVPPKWRVVPENLGKNKVDSLASMRRDILMTSLVQQGISVIDALAVMKSLGENAFLKTDTHWTPAATQAVARYSAKLIKRDWPVLPYGQVSFTLHETGRESYRGDLLNFLPLGPWLQRFGPEPDQLQQLVFSRGESTDQFANLFDFQQFPVTLVGSSYSANSRWHFANALQVELGMELLNVAQEGVGAIAPMLDYLDSSDFKKMPPSVVIWEFPERYLGVKGNVALLNRQKQNLLTETINKKEVAHHGVFQSL